MHDDTTWTRRLLVLAVGTALASAPTLAAVAAAGHSASGHQAAAATTSCAALSINSQGSAVATVQTLIGATPDGDFGSQTQAALKTWQKAHGVAASGVVDAATWAAMPASVADTACAQPVTGSGVATSCPTLTKGSTGIPVAVLQRSLSLSADGAFGSLTAAAVTAAQTSHHLSATGSTSSALMGALKLSGTPACTSGTSASAAAQAAVQALTLKRVGQLEARTTTDVSSVARAAIAFAQAQVGKPYQYGATGPSSYDCSGLTMMAYQSAAVTIPRTAAQQYAGGGQLVDLQDAQAGDLVFWANDLTQPSTIHHVAIYLGNGTIVEAPYTGAKVRVVPLYTQGLMPRVVRPSGGVALPLKAGATGHAVTLLQQALNRHGMSVSVDGGYGPGTRAAVIQWQQRHHLHADGVVHLATWLSLG